MVWKNAGDELNFKIIFVEKAAAFSAAFFCLELFVSEIHLLFYRTDFLTAKYFLHD